MLALLADFFNMPRATSVPPQRLRPVNTISDVATIVLCRTSASLFAVDACGLGKISPQVAHSSCRPCARVDGLTHKDTASGRDDGVAVDGRDDGVYEESGLVIRAKDLGGHGTCAVD